MGVLSGWVSLTGVISVLLMCKALCVSANDMNLQVAAKVTDLRSYRRRSSGSPWDTHQQDWCTACVSSTSGFVLLLPRWWRPQLLWQLQSLLLFAWCAFEDVAVGKPFSSGVSGHSSHSACVSFRCEWYLTLSVLQLVLFVLYFFFVQIICFQMIDQRKFRNGRKRVWGTGWWAWIEADNWQMDA